jgi:hypothetical protein
VVEEYCWVIMQAVGQLYYSQLGSAVLEFGFWLDAYVCRYVVDHMCNQF